VANSTGTKIIHTQLTDSSLAAEALGIAAAKDLLSQGAQSLLDTANE